jgi:hypothetical protein
MANNYQAPTMREQKAFTAQRERNKKLLDIRDNLRQKIAEEKRQQQELRNRMDLIDSEVPSFFTLTLTNKIDKAFMEKYNSKMDEFEAMYKKLIMLKNSIVL